MSMSAESVLRYLRAGQATLRGEIMQRRRVYMMRIAGDEPWHGSIEEKVVQALVAKKRLVARYDSSSDVIHFTLP